MTRVTPGNEDITAGLVDFFGGFIPRPEGARKSDDIRRGGRPKGTYGAVSGDIPVTQYPEGVRTRVGGGNAGQAQSTDEKGDAYIKPTGLPLSVDPTPAPPRAPAPAPSTGRDTPPPDGSDAKGTNTGYKIDLNAANSLLGGFGVQMADANSFLSEQLPVSASEKPVQPGESLLAPEQRSALSAFLPGKLADSRVIEGISRAGQPDQPDTSLTETADNNRSISVPGEQPEKTKRGPIRGAVDSRFDDGAEYGESYAVEKTPGRAMFSSTFLSGDGDSMAALRRAEASVGKFVQGGTVYANDGGTLREISKEAGDKMNTGTLSAQEFKDSFVSDVKQTLVPADTPDITSTQTSGSNSNNDSDGFSVDDAVSGGMSQGDAEAIGSGGQVETVFGSGVGTESEFTENNNPPSGGDTYFGGKAQGIRDMRDKYFNK
jgi:hypothetical protein